MYDSLLIFKNDTTWYIGLKGLKIQFKNYLGREGSDDLDLVSSSPVVYVEDGMVRMKHLKQWFLQMKGLEDVHISGIEVSLVESVLFFRYLKFVCFWQLFKLFFL